MVNFGPVQDMTKYMHVRLGSTLKNFTLEHVCQKWCTALFRLPSHKSPFWWLPCTKWNLQHYEYNNYLQLTGNLAIYALQLLAASVYLMCKGSLHYLHMERCKRSTLGNPASTKLKSQQTLLSPLAEYNYIQCTYTLSTTIYTQWNLSNATCLMQP